MWENVRLCAFGPAAALAIVGCGDDQQPEEAALLWQRIHDENYKAFQTAPGYEQPLASNAPHSDNTQVFLNATIAAALTGPSISEWPTGSLIVKEGTSDDGELDIVAVLDKRADGWFWAEYDGGGDVLFSGKPDTCIDCHSGSTNDFVWVLGLP
jgi:hypothetical protein